MAEAQNQQDGSPIEEPQEHRNGPNQSMMLAGSDGIESTDVNGKEMKSSMNERVGENGQNIDDFNNCTDTGY